MMRPVPCMLWRIDLHKAYITSQELSDISGRSEYRALRA